MSKVGRRLGRTGLALTIDAALQAVADAGLTPRDIDGVTSWPGFSALNPAFSPVAIHQVKEALRLELNYYCGGAEAPGQLSAVMNAAMAVTCGQARHVLVFRTLTESSGQGSAGRGPSQGSLQTRLRDRWQWLIPFAPSAANWSAMYAQVRMREFGLTRTQLGAIAINARRNAGLNAAAIYRDPLTMEDYLTSRMISTPLCIYDCDVPIDGSAAVIVSAIDAARHLPRPPIRIEAMSGALYGRDSWDQRSDLTGMASDDAGPRLWARTEFKPRDVDVLQLYDGFSIFTLMWLESLGFCERGESGAFVEGGARIALEGEFPLNTAGGQLAAGRLHGYGLLHEACLQLWGRAAGRQVPDDPQVAVVGVGGGPLASCLLLARS